MRILKQIFVFLFIWGSVIFSAFSAVADDYTPAYLYLGTSETYGTNAISVKAHYNTGGHFVNAVSMRIKFPVEMVQADDVIINESVCGMVIENYIDNATGEVNLTCGNIGNGWTGDGVLADIEFTKKAPGWTEFSFAPDAMMLAGDGTAENILEMAIGKTIITE
jgi:hypothetical protein